MPVETVKRLRAHFDGGSARRGIIDWMRRTGGRLKMGRGQSINRSRCFIAQQSIERVAERSGINGIEPAFSRHQRRKPLVQLREQRRVRHLRYVAVRLGNERRALAQGDGAFRPGKHGQPMAAHRLD